MRKIILLAFVLLAGMMMSMEYFVDPNNEFIYAVLDGFEATYNEDDGSLSVFNPQYNVVINIGKISEPVEGLELGVLADEIGKNLERSGFQILSRNDRDFSGYPASTLEGLTSQDGIAVHVEFTVIEVPQKGYYLIVAATPDESYNDLVLLLLNAKQMLMFIE